MHLLIHPKEAILPFLIALLLTCFGHSPTARAVVPPPDGGYPGGNTAEGQNALFSLNVNTGTNNTAVGWFSLRSNVSGQLNTAVGSATLSNNTGDGNTAIGGAALFSNSTGIYNTAVGLLALFNNTTGNSNTATGVNALFSNSTGSRNTAMGRRALESNNTGSSNTAVGTFALLQNLADSNTATGFAALYSNTTGVNNTANGFQALVSNSDGESHSASGRNALGSNTTGSNNTAIGDDALVNNTIGGANTAVGFDALLSSIGGTDNTAMGLHALINNTFGHFNTAIGVGTLRENTIGQGNTAIGYLAGRLSTGSHNVYIGQNVVGVAGENNTTRILNIGSTPIVGGTNVVVDGTGLIGDQRLGYASSSRRYKEDIEPMDKASETLFAMKPVSFHAKGDPARVRHYGLIAEDVAEINPDLAVYNPERQPETLHFESINAMLLNEFLKEHRKNEEQEATIAQLKSDLQANAAQHQKQIDALSAALQKVSAQLELSKVTPQTVLNRQ